MIAGILIGNLLASVVWPPSPPAGQELVAQRSVMVLRQMAEPMDDRPPIKNARVLAAMRAVPRHAFVPIHARAEAYGDHPLPIGHEQTISQPYIVALMTELAEVGEGDRVLEIGTGSGYQAAVLAHLTPHVFTIEIVEPLARQAARVLAEQGYGTVEVRAGDGYRGWPEHAPFDAILLTAAPEGVPKPLWEQLAPGGCLVVPLGSERGVQRLQVLRKGPRGEGGRETRTVMAVRFVPMTGEAQRPESPPKALGP